MRMKRNVLLILEQFRLKRNINCAIIILLSISLCACDSETANDCLQTDGDSVTFTVDLPFFDKIQLENDMRLRIEEGPVQLVSVSTGENLVPDLVVAVQDEFLILQNNNGCNFLREFGRTVVTVTSPNITFIRQASSFEIESLNTLTYPELLIWSNTGGSPVGIDDPNKSGRVTLSIDIDDFRIQANGSSAFEITGAARTADISFSDEFPQLAAGNLLVDDLTLVHVGAANMVVHPLNSISGQIRATGDVIAVNRPPTVAVEELFSGRLIFQ